MSTVIVVRLFKYKEVVQGLESQDSYIGYSPLFFPDIPAACDLGQCSVYRKWKVNRKHYYDDTASMTSSPMVK